MHACAGLQVREYCTPYIVCEGLARINIYVGLGPMILLIKAYAIYARDACYIEYLFEMECDCVNGIDR